MMRHSLIELVQKHTPFDDEESSHAQKTLQFLQANTDCTGRSNLSGHITASAWILCPQREQTLLTHHKKLNRWLQLGGHIESDHTVQQAALREAREESGIDEFELLSHAVFDIDVHTIPANRRVPEHVHYDLRFLLMAKTTQLTISEESNDLRWIDLAGIAEHVSDVSMIRMARKSIP